MPPKSHYVEILTAKVMALGGGGFWEMIRSVIWNSDV